MTSIQQASASNPSNNKEIIVTSSDTTNWKNVNNWHWLEKDVTSWAYEHLSLLFLNVKDKKFSCLEVKQVKDIKGECSVNQRKGRVKQIFDLAFDLIIENEEGNQIKAMLRDLMSDLGKEELDLKLVSLDDKLDHGKLKQILPIVRDLVWQVMEQFRIDLHNQHGNQLLVDAQRQEGKEPSSTQPPHEQTREKIRFGALEKAEKGTFLATGRIDEHITFMASPQDVFTTLTKVDRIQAWSHGSFRLVQGNLDEGSLTFGTEFTLFDGGVHVKVLDLQSKRQQQNSLFLKMKWRSAQWTPTSLFSTVLIKIEIDQTGDRSSLHLVQEGIPDNELEGTKINWQRFYWDRIKMAFGYGTIFI